MAITRSAKSINLGAATDIFTGKVTLRAIVFAGVTGSGTFVCKDIATVPKIAFQVSVIANTTVVVPFVGCGVTIDGFEFTSGPTNGLITLLLA